jgi:hypothetical protein
VFNLFSSTEQKSIDLAMNSNISSMDPNEELDSTVIDDVSEDENNTKFNSGKQRLDSRKNSSGIGLTMQGDQCTMQTNFVNSFEDASKELKMSNKISENTYLKLEMLMGLMKELKKKFISETVVLCKEVDDKASIRKNKLFFTNSKMTYLAQHTK